jgi:hypothetical protein
MALKRRSSTESVRLQPSVRQLFSVPMEETPIDLSQLDQQQRLVVDKALAGESLFVTGGGGDHQVSVFLIYLKSS